MGGTVQKGCLQGLKEVVELEEAAEEVAMVESTAPDCRSWQQSLHIRLPSRCVLSGGGGVAAAAGLG